MTYKVLLKVPMSTYSGYGNDGIGIAQAFMRRGADVYLQPTHVDAPLPPDVAELLTKELKAPFDLFINHVDPMALNCSDEVQRAADVTVGWTMWEYSNLLNVKKKSLKTMKKRLQNFDMLAGYSDVDLGSFRPYYDGPIVVRQGGFDPMEWPELQRDWDCDEFYFFMIGVLSQRKDPFRAVRAFAELRNEHEDFAKHARLSLKTTAPGLHSKMEDAYPGLRIFYDIWPTELVKQFYSVQHVLLAPSRGEGKNMPALEFMSTGGTVIATDWAGHKQWLSTQYAYPLKYDLEPVDELHKETLNARADVEHLKELMLHAFRNRDEVREKGRLAAQVIPPMCSWDTVVGRLLEDIKEQVPGKGERLWMLDAMTAQEAERARG